ncbi:hypothetical protein IG631_15031 [Alternaria alternata]|nr:hypothetical protein IG631_15031 [Alternaria alternata]
MRPVRARSCLSSPRRSTPCCAIVSPVAKSTCRASCQSPVNLHCNCSIPPISSFRLGFGAYRHARWPCIESHCVAQEGDKGSQFKAKGLHTAVVILCVK